MAALGNVKEITVYINSGGGDVFAAQTIGNMLERNGATVIAHIDGLCASAATIVACHADKVVAAADASYMVHPPSMGVCDYLTAEDMRNCIKALDAIRGNIVTLYAKKTGKTEDECGAWMDETNWWTASEAKENGFIDEVDGEETDAVVENRNGVLFVNSVSMGLPFDKAPNFVKSRMGVKTPGGFSDTANNPGMTGTQEEEAMEIKNKDDLMKAYPDMVNEIRKDPSNTDPKDRYISARRFMSYDDNNFILTNFGNVDMRANPRLREAVIEQQNTIGASYVSSQICARYEMAYLESENTEQTLADGKLYFHKYVATYLPAEAIEEVVEFDVSAIAEAMAS